MGKGVGEAGGGPSSLRRSPRCSGAVFDPDHAHGSLRCCGALVTERFPLRPNPSPSPQCPELPYTAEHPEEARAAPPPPRGQGSRRQRGGPTTTHPPRAPDCPGTNKEVSALSPPAASGTYRGRARPACWRCLGRTCPLRAGSSPCSPPRSSSATWTWSGQGRSGHREAAGGRGVRRDTAGTAPVLKGPRAGSPPAHSPCAAAGIPSRPNPLLSRPVPPRPPQPSGPLTGTPATLPAPGGGTGPPLLLWGLTERCCAASEPDTAGRQPAASRAVPGSCTHPPRLTKPHPTASPAQACCGPAPGNRDAAHASSGRQPAQEVPPTARKASGQSGRLPRRRPADNWLEALEEGSPANKRAP